MKEELYGTRLYVKYSFLESNIHHIRTLTNNMGIIAMVKANAYGHGDVAIVKKMEKLGVSAFGVADFEEGVRLRDYKINSSIIVMNPGLNSIQTIINYRLEPVIYNYNILNEIIKVKNHNRPIPVHIKINTGMNRWGFNICEVPKLLLKLKSIRCLKVTSIYSHLASAENIEEDEFTQNQINELIKIQEQFYEKLNLSVKLHVHNSFGLIRFLKKKDLFDYTRIGLALYGGLKDPNLKPVAELRCPVSQIRIISKNETVGYGRSFIADTKIKVGIVPFGYADGLQRSWGNGVLKFYYQGYFLPTVGNISMDSCMVDLSMVNNISEGDEIIYFGLQRPIWMLSRELDTIPHEIMATLSRRIKRIYLQ